VQRTAGAVDQTVSALGDPSCVPPPERLACDPSLGGDVGDQATYVDAPPSSVTNLVEQNT
jgi:hypothetical protein